MLEHALRTQGIAIPKYLRWDILHHRLSADDISAWNVLQLAIEKDHKEIVNYLLDFRLKYHKKYHFARQALVEEEPEKEISYGQLLGGLTAVGIIPVGMAARSIISPVATLAVGTSVLGGLYMAFPREDNEHFLDLEQLADSSGKA